MEVDPDATQLGTVLDVLYGHSSTQYRIRKPKQNKHTPKTSGAESQS